uniref:Chaperone DnaJ C-terminal domain-containing protein n=1 Tax=Salix viminalis TaxID=40686 RepID=A0A6N2LP25_SALVM
MLILAILGGKVEVPTLSGKTQVNIPKGVQPGQLVVLRGKGLSKHGFLVDHGDQYVRFCINFPTAINERQRAILEEFTEEEINNQNDTSNEGTWWQQLLEGLTHGGYWEYVHQSSFLCCSLLRSFSFSIDRSDV